MSARNHETMQTALYYLQDARGPHDLEQLRHLWRTGKITKATMFLETGSEEWLPLSALTELFEAPRPVVRPLPLAAIPPPAPRLEDHIAAGILKAVAVLAIAALIAGVIVFVFHALSQ